MYLYVLERLSYMMPLNYKSVRMETGPYFSIVLSKDVVRY